MASPILDLLFINVSDPVLSISTVVVHLLATVATDIIPMPIVAVPVSVCYVVVNQGSVFILTELADQFRFQC